MPVERLDNGSWPHPARLPLGAGWRGYCTAPGHDQALPQQHILEAFCNLGYATSCPWAPSERIWDAVRFAVAVSPEAAKRGGGSASTDVPARTLHLRYVCERGHLPVDHGDLEYDLSHAAWLRRHDDPRLQKMAECFLDSYLNKKT